MIIFVAGIHGVGKTYLARLAVQQLGIKHATASQLIREERETQSWTENKQVSEIHNNQIALISALKKIKNTGESLLLDGHFVLLGGNNVHIKISNEIFRALEIDAVILLEADPDTICARLIARGDHSWDTTSLASFAASESTHAVSVSSSIGLPLQRMKNAGHVQFISTIKSFLDNIHNTK